MLSPTPAGRGQVPSHTLRVQSRWFAARPGFLEVQKIEQLRGSDLQIALQTNVRLDAEIGKRGYFRWEARFLCAGLFLQVRASFSGLSDPCSFYRAFYSVCGEAARLCRF